MEKFWISKLLKLCEKIRILPKILILAVQNMAKNNQ